jgi:hypothetical protein
VGFFRISAFGTMLASLDLSRQLHVAFVWDGYPALSLESAGLHTDQRNLGSYEHPHFALSRIGVYYYFSGSWR